MPFSLWNVPKKTSLRYCFESIVQRESKTFLIESKRPSTPRAIIRAVAELQLPRYQQLAGSPAQRNGSTFVHHLPLTDSVIQSPSGPMP